MKESRMSVRDFEGIDLKRSYSERFVDALRAQWTAKRSYSERLLQCAAPVDCGALL